MLSKTINEEWESLASTVLSRFDPVELKEAKMVFFSGAYAMSVLMLATAARYESDEEGSVAVMALHNECATFFFSIKGFADRGGWESIE